MVPKQTYEGQATKDGDGLALRYLWPEPVRLHHECRRVFVPVSVRRSGTAESSDVSGAQLLRQPGSTASCGGLHSVWIPESLEAGAKEWSSTGWCTQSFNQTYSGAAPRYHPIYTIGAEPTLRSTSSPGPSSFNVGRSAPPPPAPSWVTPRWIHGDLHSLTRRAL